MITPFPAGGLFNRSTMNAKLEEIGGAITEANWQLIEVLDNMGPMSGTWTAPDFFGDGSAYDLGVYMIGGGGSGGSISATGHRCASGGASGYGRNLIINNVTPGAQYSYVIGEGGAPVSSSGAASDGNNGGSTSFNGVSTDGGFGGRAIFGSSVRTYPGTSGGQASDGTRSAIGPNDSYSFLKTNRRLYGCCVAYTFPNDEPGVSQSPRDGQCQFDQTMITLSAGGGTGYGLGSGFDYNQSIVALPDGTKGGNGGGQSATGYGNGGGGNVNGASGAGSDGAIFLYARRPQEVTA